MDKCVLEQMLNTLKGKRTILNLYFGETYIATFVGKFSYEILSGDVYELAFDNSTTCLEKQEIKLVSSIIHYIKAVILR